MLKILLVGISTSGASYNKCQIFRNKKLINTVYDDNVHLFTDAKDVLGELPCTVSQLYNDMSPDQNQKNYEKSLYKNFKDLELLINNSQSYDFSEDEIEIHTFKVANDQYATINIKDTTSAGGEYGKPLGTDVLVITADRRGNEYNYFTIDISSTSLTIKYNPPSDPTIGQIVDSKISVPYTKKLRYKDVHEIRDIIEKSPFGKYLTCEVQYFRNDKLLTKFKNEYIEMPNEPSSYRLNEVNTMYAIYNNKLSLDYGDGSILLDNVFTKDDILSMKVTTTHRYFVTGEEYIKVNASDAISKPSVIKGAAYVENEDNITSFLKISKTATLGDEILVSFEQRVNIKSEDFFSLSNSTGRKTVITLNNTLSNAKYDIEMVYGKNVKDFNTFSRGILSKGYITDVIDWNKKVDDVEIDMWSGFVWVEMIRPNFTELVRDVKNGKSDITISELKQVYLKYLNNLVDSTEFQQIGINDTVQINNIIIEEGYTDFSCRRINLLSIKEEDDPTISDDLVIDLTTEYSMLPIFHMNDSFNKADMVRIYYTHYGNFVSGSFSPKEGKDIYEMNDEEYFRILQEKYYEANIDDYILTHKINEIVLCGCYENTYQLKTTIDDDTGLNDEVVEKQYTIYKSMLVPNSKISSKFPSKYYYKLPNDLLDNVIIKSIEVGGVSTSDIAYTLVDDTIYFNDFNVVTGLPDVDVKHQDMPMTFYIKYTLFINKKIAYSEFVDLQYTVDDDSDTKYTIHQSMPFIFRMSMRPFTLTSGLINSIGNLERKYLDYLRDQILLFNYGAVRKSNIIRYSVGNIYTEHTFSGITFESFIDSGVFSIIADYICMQLYKTRKAINWTEEFDGLVHSRYITEILEQNIIKDYTMNGIELFEARTIDDAVLCVVNKTVNTLEILKNPTYQRYVKDMILTIHESRKKFIGLLMVTHPEIENTMREDLLTTYGGLIKDVTVTVTNQDLGHYEIEINITFVNITGNITIPLILL